MAKYTVGMAGNPNCGKTTVFNALTGAHQRTGNWPGITVERRSGDYEDEGDRITAIDLPGVYSLSAASGADSMDETIGRDFILSGEADVIVNIVDAANLERNLYLCAQIAEMQVPMVVALNMMDAAQRRGIEINVAELERRLGVPVIPIVALRGKGMKTLRKAIHQATQKKPVPNCDFVCAAEIETAVSELLPLVNQAAATSGMDARWLAVKLLEDDSLAAKTAGSAAAERARTLAASIKQALGEDIDTLIADARFSSVNELVRQVIRHRRKVRQTTSDILDRVVLNHWLGLPIFLVVVYLMFMFTINLGSAFVDFFDMAAGTIFVDGVGALLEAIGAPAWVKVLLADGVGGGVQVVATFIPIIGFLYLSLSLLEDSGYLARAAFMMDRFMRVIGLPGKAFVPLIIGFGCNVPSVIASRSLEKERDRTMSVMMAPFMSCGARLAVYALFAAAFFPVGGQNLIFALYLVGVAMAVLTGFILKHTLLRGDTSPFMMELPPYRLPSLRGIFAHSWVRLRDFVFGAGQVIVVVVALLSFLNSWGVDGSFGNEDSETSVLSVIGKTIVPVFTPMGINQDNWPATVGIFTGIFAKEAVVGTLDALYSGLAKQDAAMANTENAKEPEAGFDLIAGLSQALATIPGNLAGLRDLAIDPLGIGVASGSAEEQGVSNSVFGAMVTRFDGRLGAFVYMLFILLYTPCVATMGAINRELGPAWTTFSTAWTTGLAYGVSVMAYQAGAFFRHPGTSAAWIGSIILLLLLTIIGLRIAGRNRRFHSHAATSEP